MILLTGGSGFIGKHLLEFLTKEYGTSEILSLTSTPISGTKYLLHHNYSFENNFFEKAGLANSIDTIIHAGAFIPKSAENLNNSQLCNTNVLSTEKLISANLPNLKKIIFISTIDVYGKGEVITETSLVEPVSVYAQSKLKCEELLSAWANQQKKILQILRIGHVYGPGEEEFEKVIPVTMKKLKENQPVQIFGSGNELRSYMFVKDVANAIVNSLNLNESIGTLNIVGSAVVSINELVNKIISISGTKVEIERKDEQRKGRDLIFDNSKMKHYLFQNETPLDDGLREEWNYMINLS